MEQRFLIGFIGLLGFLGFVHPAYFLFFLFFLFFLPGIKTKKFGETVSPTNLIDKQAQEKALHLEKIKEFMQDKDKVANKDIAEMLGISEATAVRYFDELEKTGFLKQVGKTGKYVFYSKV